MVRGLKVLRHRRTEGGCFSEFLIAKAPPATEDIENRAPAIMRSNNAHCSAAQQITLTQHSQSQCGTVIDTAAAGSQPSTWQQQQQQQQQAAARTTTTTTSTRAAPADTARRAKRRERNRLAAAKCRKKRQDQMEGLAEVCHDLEASNSQLQQQIAELANAKLQLLQLLQSHEPDCVSGGLQLPHLDDPELVLEAEPVIVDLGDCSLHEEDSLTTDEAGGMDSLMFSPPMLSSAASPSSSSAAAAWMQNSLHAASPAATQQRPNELLLLPVTSPMDTGLASLATPMSTLLTPLSSALVKAEMES